MLNDTQVQTSSLRPDGDASTSTTTWTAAVPVSKTSQVFDLKLRSKNSFETEARESIKSSFHERTE